jgi:PAS domain S-box-containing protein
MKKTESTRVDPAELRVRAEHRLKENATRAEPTSQSEEAQRLIHELQVHQIELEVQNEELQKARAELEAGLQRYSDLYDFAPWGYVTFDRDGTIRKVNLAGARLLGLERARLVGARFDLFVTTVCRPTFGAFLRKVFDSQAAETCDVGLCPEHGAPLWVHVEAVASGEGCRECRAILTDISKRKQADAYREMGREVLQILNQTGDLHPSIQRVLVALRTWTGCDAVGIRLQQGDDFPYFAQEGFPDEFLSTENTLVERDVGGGICRDKNGNVHLECACGLVIAGKTDAAKSLFTPGGSFWINDSTPFLDSPPAKDSPRNSHGRCLRDGYASMVLVPIRNQERNVGLIQLNDRRKEAFTIETVELLEGIASHIGAALMRKQAEEALRQSERRFRALADNSPDLVIRYDRALRVEFANLVAARRFGLAAQDIIGKTLAEMRRPPETIAAIETMLKHVFETGETQSLELNVQGRWFEVLVVPERDSSGAMISALNVARDITEHKRAEEAIKQSEQRSLEAAEVLREVDRNKSRFLAVLSHELRNPLAPITNSLYILDHAVPGDAQARRAQAVIGRQVGQLSRLVDDLLDSTRMSSNKLTLQRQRLDLNELVRGTLDDHRPQFERNEVRLESHPAAEPVFVHGDWNRLAQVVGNLLQNTAKFTGPGGCARVSVSTDTDTKRAVVRVADTGAGMAPEMLARLFQPFAQADATLDRSKGGLGLGLALVKGLVELHGGTIAAHSAGVGQGAEFVVRLPLALEEVVTDGPVHSRTVVSGGRRRVLIIEDNIDAADSLREALELGGHEVEVAYTGTSGIAKAHKRKPEVVFCDIGLPGMDGFDVARALRADDALKGVYLVALSGYARPEDIQRASEAGFDQHLAKPPDLEKLEQVVAQVPAARVTAEPGRASDMIPQ